MDIESLRQIYYLASESTASAITFLDSKARILILVTSATIALFLAYQKLTHKLELSCKISQPRFSHNYISNIVISNKRDRATSVWAIYLYINKESVLTLVNYETPLIIKSYESASIALPKFSKLLINGDVFEPDLFNDKLEIKIDIGSKLLKCDILIKEDPITHYTVIEKIEADFNGFVYDDSVKYILKYQYQNKLYVAFLGDSGFIGNEWDFSPFVLGDRTSVTEIKHFLVTNELHRAFQDYTCYRVINLDAKVVFTKSDVDSENNEKSKI